MQAVEKKELDSLLAHGSRESLAKFQIQDQYMPVVTQFCY